MINLNKDIFQRIYQDVLEIRKDLQDLCNDNDYHEWIDFEEHPYKPCILHDREWVVIEEINGLSPMPSRPQNLHSSSR